MNRISFIISLYSFSYKNRQKKVTNIYFSIIFNNDVVAALAESENC